MKYIFAFLALISVLLFGLAILLTGLHLVPIPVGVITAVAAVMSVFAFSRTLDDFN